MPPVQRSSRANLHDYKNKFKILGQAKETQYWQLLSSFLSFKLSKAELDKQVLSTIGKENVVLHNQFLRAIFSNALCNEAPPPPSSFVHDISKPVKGIRRKPLVASISNEEPGPGSPVPAIRTNGDGAIPSSPKKGRSAIRDRKAKERPSPLGFHHRGEASTSQGGSADEETPRSLENGGLKTPDMSRPVQQYPYPAEHSNLELSSPVPPAAKRPRLGFTGSGAVLPGDGKSGSGHVGREMEVDDAEDDLYEEESDEEDIFGMPNGFIKPPMGCVVSYGGPRVERFINKFPPPPVTQTLLGDKLEEEILDGDYLPDTERLHRSMQLMAAEKGLEDVNLETARCVNKALDVYLKAIIQPLIELVKSRRSRNLGENRDMPSGPKENGGSVGKEARKDNAVLVHKQLNGPWSDHIPSREGTVSSGEGSCDEPGKHRALISSLDLKVAMDLNPKVLGEDWPTHLEKISFRSFDP